MAKARNRSARTSRIQVASKRSSRHDGSNAAATNATAEAAYEAFLGEAKALSPREVVVCRADVSLLYDNVRAGVEAVLAERATIKTSLPKLDLSRLALLPDLALALVYAAAQVDRGARSDGTTAALLKEMRPLREMLLSSAVALATAGVLPRREVDKIRRGTGPRDAAQDCVDLAALFRKHATTVKGKTAISRADLDRAAKIGSTLLTTLKPTRTKRVRTPPEVAAAANVRDRLWTLLARDHDRLVRRPAFFLFGEAIVDARAPALQAHRAALGKKKAKTPQPTGSATGTGG